MYTQSTTNLMIDDVNSLKIHHYSNKIKQKLTFSFKVHLVQKRAI